MRKFKSPVVNIESAPGIDYALMKQSFVTVRENGYLIRKVENWMKK